MTGVRSRHMRVVAEEKEYRVIEIHLYDLPLYLASRAVEAVSYEYFQPVQDEVLRVAKKEDGNVSA